MFITINIFYLFWILSAKADNNICCNINLNLTWSQIDMPDFNNDYREYLVDYIWRKYDWIDIEWQIRYNLAENIAFKAHHDNKIIIKIDNNSTWNYLKNISIKISKILENNSLENRYNYNEDFWDNITKKEISIENKNNIFTETWKYRITVELNDYDWNKTVLNSMYFVDFSNTIFGQLNLVNNDLWEKYWNNIDYYEYKASISDSYWNYVKDVKIENITHYIENYTNWKKINTNSEDENSNDAIHIFEISEKVDNNSQLTFKVKSLAPWFFTQRFKIELEWDINAIVLNNSTNYFKKPVWGELLASINNLTWDYLPEIWENINYKIKLNTNNINKSDLNIEFDINKITPLNPETYLTWTTFFNKINKKFKTTIEKTNSWSITKYAWISLWDDKSEVFVSYFLSWSTIKYRLSPESNYFTDSPLIIENNPEDNTIINVKIIWQSGDDIDVDFQNTIINNSRTQIRQKAYTYIDKLNSWDVVWWVKYIDWDYSIYWNDIWYETLVITNGNLTISWDLNTNNKPLGIIVLKDGYNIENWYNWKWNIFIDENVKQINALIYSDGAILKDTDSDKQLHIKWSLITRNTIWWAKVDKWKHKLPWWWETKDFNLARIYDLNYLRNGNKECLEKENTTDADWNTIEICKYDEHLIIEYNPSLISNPPKLFY